MVYKQSQVAEWQECNIKWYNVIYLNVRMFIMSDWKNFININGDFELPNFLYRTINDLMKQALDMGTLLSDDPYKLRAYKEQTKKLFKYVEQYPAAFMSLPSLTKSFTKFALSSGFTSWVSWKPL